MMEAYYLEVEGRKNKGYLPTLVILSNRVSQTSMGFHAIYTHKGSSIHSNCHITYVCKPSCILYVYMYACMYRKCGRNSEFKRITCTI